MRVKLLTRNRKDVAIIDIPDFWPHPEVVQWGSRVFVHDIEPWAEFDETGKLLVRYLEGMLFVIPSGSVKEEGRGR